MMITFIIIINSSCSSSSSTTDDKGLFQPQNTQWLHHGPYWDNSQLHYSEKQVFLRYFPSEANVIVLKENNIHNMT